MAFGLWLVLCPPSVLLADQPPSLTSDPSSEQVRSPLPTLDREPYRIRLLLDIDFETRIDGPRREALLNDWLTLVRRFVGAPWSIEIAPGSQNTAVPRELNTLRPEDFAELSTKVDKVWIARISASGSGLMFQGRELDVRTGRFGSLQVHVARVVRDAPRALFQFALALFSPYAVIGERSGKDVFLTVQGTSIVPSTPIGRIVSEGTLFQPLRIVERTNEKPLVREIPYTFLRVVAVEGARTRCSVVSVHGDPFTRRVIQKSSLSAVGIKAGKTPTRLRFLTLPDRAPAAGYVLTTRNYPDGSPREVGTTDREGRIVLEPTVNDDLQVLRLFAGSKEPMIEFPLMPGASTEERTLPPFDPKGWTVALESRLDALRDTIIDLVAIRARLEARLKSRFDGEDWSGAEEVLKEFRQLPPRSKFAEELTRLKEESMQRQARSKRPILTKTAQAQLVDLQAVLDRYLEDEIFRAYAEALEKLKTEPPGKSRTESGRPSGSGVETRSHARR
ncbi:MAG: hypothetical protein NVSMB9_03290 [Isosphaeraceae bacterium]